LISAGIKELKAKLSSYVDRARGGEQVVITEHGEEVAVLMPISKERKAIKELVGTGRAHWSGGKPKGMEGIRLKGRPLADTILEERQ
jgi:prevent-host-death family protein